MTEYGLNIGGGYADTEKIENEEYSIISTNRNNDDSYYSLNMTAKPKKSTENIATYFNTSIKIKAKT
jgi:hypothetical protein